MTQRIEKNGLQVATELAGVGLTRIGTVLNRFNARSAVGFRSTARPAPSKIPKADNVASLNR